jgi:hypothetical protein
VPPARVKMVDDSLDISPSNNRLIVTLAASASDIWLVELR